MGGDIFVGARGHTGASAMYIGPMRLLAWLRSRPLWERRLGAVLVCLVLGVIASLGLAWGTPVVRAYRQGAGVTYSKPSESMMLRADDGREFEATVIRNPLGVEW